MASFPAMASPPRVGLGPGSSEIQCWAPCQGQGQGQDGVGPTGGTDEVTSADFLPLGQVCPVWSIY